MMYKDKDLIDTAIDAASEFFGVEPEYVNQRQIDFMLFIMTGEVAK